MEESEKLSWCLANIFHFSFLGLWCSVFLVKRISWEMTWSSRTCLFLISLIGNSWKSPSKANSSTYWWWDQILQRLNDLLKLISNREVLSFPTGCSVLSSFCPERWPRGETAKLVESVLSWKLLFPRQPLRWPLRRARLGLPPGAHPSLALFPWWYSFLLSSSGPRNGNSFNKLKEKRGFHGN